MSKYPISKEYRFLRNIKIPFNQIAFQGSKILSFFLELFLKSKKNLTIRKIKILTRDQKKIKIFYFNPKTEPSKILFYMHGGAFVYKGSWKHFSLCQKYAQAADCKIIYVDYRTAPKYPYPIPLNDCFDAYKWVIENYEDLKIDLGKIMIGGDSAGGCLTVDLYHKILEHHLIKPCFQFLIYPALDSRMTTNSMKRFSDTPIWNSKLNHKMWKIYLGSQKYLSPCEKSVKNFPPTYIETAEYDCLKDEALFFCYQLEKENIPVILNNTAKTVHGFDLISCKTTEKVIQKRIEILKKL